MIIECAMNKGASNEELLSISRSRGSLCAICIPNMVTADGKYLDKFAIVRTSSNSHVSKYKVPNETPTQGDWTRWPRL